MGAVIGVVGGSGGVGASSFAAVLAAVCGRALLVDLDAASGGVDVLLGIEAAPGVRWSGLQLGGGRLDPRELFDRLPRWGPVSVLAADVRELDPDAVRQVLDTGRGEGAIVVDLPRSACAERAAALLHCDVVVVLARADVSGLVGAHAIAGALPEIPLGMVIRRDCVAGADAAALVGCPLLGELPANRSPWALDPARLPRAHARVASGVLHGLDPARVAPAA
jgi:secretion/DNA translocation related CpaE-like protein